MTSPTLFTAGGLPIPGLSKEPNVPLDLSILGTELDNRTEARFSSVTERDGTWDAATAPLGARCFITGTGRAYIRWATATAPAWYELRRGALVVANVGERDALTPVPDGMLVRDATTQRIWERYSGAWLLQPGMAGVRVSKAGTQPIAATTWTMMTWDNPGNLPPHSNGMWASATPSRVVATERGRYRSSFVASGGTNFQIRANSAGASAGGTQVGALTGINVSSIGSCVADEVVLNANDYLEAFIYNSTAGNAGTATGYVASFTLSYIGPAIL